MSRKLTRRQFLVAGLATSGGVVLTACGATPTATPTKAPPTATKAPTATVPPPTQAPAVIAAPTATRVPPTATLVPPTATSVVPKPAATPTPAAKQPKKGGVLKAGVNQDALSIDPHKHKNIVETYFKSMVYSQLVKQKANFEVEMDLAERYQEVDSVTYVFYLRKGVKFHDGDELTADDVKASHERLLDPANAALSYVYLKNIDKITVKDTYTVEFKLKNPQATFIPAMALPSNYIAKKKLIEKPGVDFEKEVIGTGPFRFVSRTVGVETRVERNPNYFISGLPYLDEVRMRPIADDSARMNALRAGDVDLVTFVPWAAMGSVEADAKLVLASLKEGGYVHIEFMVERPPMDSVKLRQAINYAIDREAIVKTAASGRGRPCYGSPIASWSWAYNKDVENTYKYNPEKAKQLLQEAGAQGLKLELVTWAVDTELFGRPSVVVANNLKQVGLDVTLKPVSLAEWSEIHAKSTYQMEMYGGVYSFPDPDFISNFYGPGGQYTVSTKFADKEMEAWLTQARAITDRAKRKELYDKITKKGLDLAPHAILFYREQGDAFYKYVQGYEHLGSASFNSMTHLWLDK